MPIMDNNNPNNTTRVNNLRLRINNLQGNDETKVSLADKFSLIDTFPITATLNYKHRKLLKNLAQDTKRGLHFYDDDMTQRHYGRVSNRLLAGESYTGKIWQINESQRLTSPECLQFLADNKVLLTGAQGLAVGWQQSKEYFPLGKWLISFDEKNKLWKDANGVYRLPCVLHLSEDDYKIYLDCFDDVWDDGYSLFGICK
jgi:hypothetical protein